MNEMYCSNCGAKNEEGVKFCTNCGASVGEVPKRAQQSTSYQPQTQYSQKSTYSGSYQQQGGYYQSPQVYLPQKSAAVAVILSLFIFPGLGQIYAGKVGRGFAFLFGLMGGGVLVGVTAFFFIFWTPYIPIFIISIVGLFVIQIWCVVDSYKTAEKYNRFVNQHEILPRPNDVW
ncbi:MAG: zinc ribbon domain-containing protein [Candidatus Heimdallarchaeota archaeon]|nr:zinc ribbon domain-containing protein [Candidatus Heimdallarchaeota archaeon]MCK4954334.1 zinc ribbon domain-containing protein [Candidatus Heimdallarchaeota archaeon]